MKVNAAFRRKFLMLPGGKVNALRQGSASVPLPQDRGGKTVMNQHVAVPIEARKAIDAYLRDREGELVCIGDAVRAVRNRISRCKRSDRELGDAIAAAAVSSGNPVFFDGAEPNGPDRKRAREDTCGPRKEDRHRAQHQMSDIWPLR